MEVQERSHKSHFFFHYQRTKHSHQISKQHNVPIIGQGGITSAHDALEFIIAGAAAVGVGTALFYDPLICPKINQGIVDYLDEHDIDNVSDLVGTLELHNN